MTLIINYYFESCVKSHSHELMGHVTNRWWGANKLEGVNFHIFIFSICHSWLMTKWCGHPIIIIMIKKSLEVIWYEHKKPYPPPPPTYIPTYLPMCPPTHPPTSSTYQLAYPPFIFYLLQPAYLPTSYLSSYNLPTTYFIIL